MDVARERIRNLRVVYNNEDYELRKKCRSISKYIVQRRDRTGQRKIPNENTKKSYIDLFYIVDGTWHKTDLGTTPEFCWPGAY